MPGRLGHTPAPQRSPTDALALAAALLAPTLGLAAATPAKDCPPLGSLPDFLVDANTLKTYDTLEFERKTASGDVELFDASGQVCIAA